MHWPISNQTKRKKGWSNTQSITCKKYGPALNQSQLLYHPPSPSVLKDHIVRKIFSKFKKTNTSNDLTCLLPDLERGLEGGNTTPRGSTLLLSPTKGRPHTRALSMSTYPHAQCPRAQVPTCPHAHMPTCPRAMLYTAIRLIPGRVSLAKV